MACGFRLKGIGGIEAAECVSSHAVSANVMPMVFLGQARFASQPLAVIRDPGIDPSKVNPLGATGAIRVATLMSATKRGDARQGMVTMCIGTGLGAAGLFEVV